MPDGITVRSIRWMVAASFLLGVWIGARESALRASMRTRAEGVRSSWGAASYGTFEEVEASLQRWAETHGEHVRIHRLATSRDRRPLLALEVAPGSLEPIGDASARPWTVLVIGGLDGRSVAGVHAVMLAAERAIATLPNLRTDVRLLFVPAGAPDALAHAAATPDGSGRGRNKRPLDDDRDGRVDEDPPDDLDGDGLILDMLIEDPEGAWAFTGNPRELVRAQEGMAPRYRLVPEGRDDDGDGAFNEDGPGGVDYSTHFPVGWSPPRPGSLGVRPLAEAVPRALAEFAVEERVDIAFFFEGNHGGLAFPGDPEGPRDGFEHTLKALFERATGRSTTGEPRRTPAPGHMMTWLRVGLGVPAVEVAAWGPEVVGVDGRPFARAASDTGGDASRAWRRWVDEVRGGEGFVDWHPADLGRGRVALVGGFEPRTRTDPPEELLGAAVRGLDAFIAEVAEALPRLDIEVVEVTRHGDCVDLKARVVNRSGLSLDFRGAPVDARLELRAEGDVVVLAGSPSVALPALHAFEASATEAWFVRLPAGATLTLTATYDGDRRVVRELRP